MSKQKNGVDLSEPVFWLILKVPTVFALEIDWGLTQSLFLGVLTSSALK